MIGQQVGLREICVGAGVNLRRGEAGLEIYLPQFRSLVMKAGTDPARVKLVADAIARAVGGGLAPGTSPVTWNAERTIADTIRSVIAQDHVNWELLIGDDGSTDGSMG